MAALDISGDSEIMLAVVRLNWASGSDEAEFAVAVGDPWQGQGVGAELLRCLILIAQKHGLGAIWGLVLRENPDMIELARKLGFTMVTGMVEPRWKSDRTCEWVWIWARTHRCTPIMRREAAGAPAPGELSQGWLEVFFSIHGVSFAATSRGRFQNLIVLMAKAPHNGLAFMLGMT